MNSSYDVHGDDIIVTETSYQPGYKITSHTWCYSEGTPTDMMQFALLEVDLSYINNQ